LDFAGTAASPAAKVRSGRTMPAWRSGVTIMALTPAHLRAVPAGAPEEPVPAKE